MFSLHLLSGDVWATMSPKIEWVIPVESLNLSELVLGFDIGIIALGWECTDSIGLFMGCDSGVVGQALGR